MSQYIWGNLLSFLAPSIANKTGQGVKIALLDSGVDFSHPALGHLKHTGRCFDANNPRLQVRSQHVRGDDDVYNHSDSNPSKYHGSNLAGILAGWFDHPDQAYVGIAPNVTLCIFKVSEPDGFISLDAYYRALAFAVYDLDVDIVCSAVVPASDRRGSIRFNSPSLTQLLRDLTARKVLFFQSLKNVNYPRSLGPLSFPAQAPSVNFPVTINVCAMTGHFQKQVFLGNGNNLKNIADYLIPQIEVSICDRNQNGSGLSSVDLSSSQATAVMAGAASLLLQGARERLNDPQMRLSRKDFIQLIDPACLFIPRPEPIPNSNSIVLCRPNQ